MISSDDALRIAERVVALAQRQGASDAEGYVCALQGSLIEHMGPLTSAADLSDSGIALRLVQGSKVGGAHAYGISSQSIQRVVGDALARTQIVPERLERPRFPDPAPVGAPTPTDPRLVHADLDRLAADAATLANALAESPLVSYHSVSLKTRAYTFAVANTRGVGAWDQDAVQTVSLDVRVTDAGVSRTAVDGFTTRTPVTEHKDLGLLAREAVERAKSSLRAQPLPAPTREVVLDPGCVSQVFNLWLPSLSGALVREHRSRLCDRLGHEVASPLLTVADAPREPRGGRNQRMDDEGVPTRTSPLLDRGRLRTFLYNTTAGNRQGVPSTGHGFRPVDRRWAGGLAIRTANLLVRPGPKELEDLVAGMDRGVLVQDALLGAFAANDTTGDFSLLCPLAFYVRNGSIVHALPPTMVAGNAHDVLANVQAVGRTQKPLLTGNFPALHVSEVACAT